MTLRDTDCLHRTTGVGGQLSMSDVQKGRKRLTRWEGSVPMAVEMKCWGMGEYLGVAQ
jgi:hypothetical protein